MRNTPRHLIVATLCAFAAATATAGPTTWQVASGARADTFQTVNLKTFAAEVAAATHGELAIEVHTDDSLGKLTEIPHLIETGKIPAGQALITTLQPQTAVAGSDTLPFLLSNYESARRLWAAQKPVIDRELAKRGLMELYAVPWPPQGLFTDRPIERAEDLRDVPTRTYNPPSVRIAQLMRAKGVNIPRSALAKAMAEGSVDALITSAATGVEDEVWTRMKYFYDIRAWYPKDILMVSKARFEALPKGTRDAILAAAGRAEERGWQASEASVATAVKELTAHGVKVGPPSSIFHRELGLMGEHASRDWLRETGNVANEILVPFFVANGQH